MSKSKIAQRVAQIKAKISRENWTTMKLSQATGVPYTTMSRVRHDDWNPTLLTLIAVEEALFTKSERMRNG